MMDLFAMKDTCQNLKFEFFSDNFEWVTHVFKNQNPVSCDEARKLGTHHHKVQMKLLNYPM